MEIRIGQGSLTLDSRGYMEELITFDKSSIYPHGVKEPFLQIHRGQELLPPESMTQDGNRLTFAFGGGTEAVLAYEEKETHTTFEVLSVNEDSRHIIFGPIPCTVHEMIGDVVGVVWDGHAALGVQGLSRKTVPGFPCCEALGYGKYGSEKVMSDISVGTCDYFRSAAYQAECGSVLQMFCENRKIARYKKVNNAEHVYVAPCQNEDADIQGAKIALFTCPGGEALATIGKLELCEGLPHPMMDGEWGKTARTAMRSYLISEFGPANIDKMLDYTKKGGFRELYHPEPFDTWGHFRLAAKWFPNGDADLTDCSNQAAGKGIGLGLHTLTAFTTTNDEYVTSIPHPNLAKMGMELLAGELDETTAEIPVKDTALFLNQTYLQVIQIGEELIQFASVNTEEKRLENCTRGAFGTVPAAHSPATPVYLLWDHGYKTLFPNIHLQDRFCDRLVELFNSCNLVQISFDGLEGCSSCGEDEYASNRFCMRCYEGWDHEVINDASNLDHFLWHMNTRMNWGEPWGEKMRTGMTGYRMKNQDFFEKNLFPRMLGWFLMRTADRKFEATTLDDIEWALSMAAGYDAGFALCVSEACLDKLGITGEILETVRCWEQLRMADAFSSEVKERLKAPATEWHLEKNPQEEASYLLYPTDLSQQFTCDLSEMQPGQKGGSDWACVNQFEKQEYRFRIRVLGDGYIENPFLTTRSGSVKIPCRAENNQYILYNGNSQAVVTDRNYNVISSCTVQGKGILDKGQQPLSFSCTHGGEEPPEVRISIVTYGEPTEIKL